MGSLEDVGDEVVTPVVATGFGIEVFPLPVVDGDLHFRWIAIVEAIRAAIVFAAVEVLRVVDVRVVLEAGEIAGSVAATPRLAESLGLLGLGGRVPQQGAS